MISVEVQDLAVAYRGKQVVSSLTFTVSAGEVVAFMGRSGSGKTTILKAVAGIGALTTKGSVKWLRDGRRIREYRPLGYVQQDAAIPDWFTAGGYVRMCATKRKLQRSSEKGLIDDLLASVGLDPIVDGPKPVAELSGGMATRVGLAGAIATGSNVLMLDEPFSMIDDLRRYELLDLTKKILDDDNKLGLIVTHSALEAAFLADRIVVLRNASAGEYQTIGGLRKLEASAAQVDLDYAAEVRKKINAMLMG